MGFYERRVLPHLINLAMDTKAVRDERRRCLEHVADTVLEVGFGTGLNLPYYPPSVTKVVGVDPSNKSADLARRRIAAAKFPVEVIGLSAEKLPGGCHLDRPISALIEDAGFEIERLEHHYMQGAPKFAGFLYRGVARRRKAE